MCPSSCKILTMSTNSLRDRELTINNKTTASKNAMQNHTIIFRWCNASRTNSSFASVNILNSALKSTSSFSAIFITFSSDIRMENEHSIHPEKHSREKQKILLRSWKHANESKVIENTSN